MPPAITPEQVLSINFDNPLYFTETDSSVTGCRLKYHHNSVPLCADPNTWRSVQSTIRIHLHDNGARISIPGNTIDSETSSTTDFSIFKSEVQSNTEEIIKSYEGTRYRAPTKERTLPKPIHDTVRSLGDTYAESRFQVQQNWQSLHGFGPQRVHQILYTDPDSSNTPPNQDDVVMVACSHCGNGFWQFIDNKTKLSQLHTTPVYCPYCHHNVSQPGCIGHNRIPTDSFITPDPTPPFPRIAPYERNFHSKQ